jgi:hypothetical protein
VYKLPREHSDHNPIIVSDAIKQPLNHLKFRFELSWIKNHEFLTKVEEIWETPNQADTTFDRIQKKLKKFKQYFKGWGFHTQGACKKLKT